MNIAFLFAQTDIQDPMETALYPKNIKKIFLKNITEVPEENL